MNKVTKFSWQLEDIEIIEERKEENSSKGNPYRAKDGKFTTGPSGRKTKEKGVGSDKPGELKGQPAQGTKSFYTKEEADKLTKDSIYKSELGHGTANSYAERIKEQGFNTSKSGSVSSRAVSGDGVYFSNSTEVTDYFAKQTEFYEYKKSNPHDDYRDFLKYRKGKLGSEIKVKVNIQNPKRFDTVKSYDSELINYAIKQKLIADKSGYENLPPDRKAQLSQDFGNELLKKHDSIIIEKDDMGILTRYGTSIGDNTTVVVKDARNIFPYKVRKAN